MNLAVVALIFLLAAIVLGFVKKMNVGLVCLGLAFILGQIGNVPTRVILGGFPSSLFLTLLGTMFFYAVSFILSAAGPGAIFVQSVQAVMIIFAVSLAVQMNASPILMGGMAILGAVGGRCKPNSVDRNTCA